MMAQAVHRSVYVGRTDSEDAQFGRWKVQAYEGQAVYDADYTDDETVAYVLAAQMAQELGWAEGTFYIGTTD